MRSWVSFPGHGVARDACELGSFRNFNVFRSGMPDRRMRSTCRGSPNWLSHRKLASKLAFLGGMYIDIAGYIGFDLSIFIFRRTLALHPIERNQRMAGVTWGGVQRVSRIGERDS